MQINQFTMENLVDELNHKGVKIEKKDPNYVKEIYEEKFKVQLIYLGSITNTFQKVK